LDNKVFDSYSLLPHNVPRKVSWLPSFYYAEKSHWILMGS